MTTYPAEMAYHGVTINGADVEKIKALAAIFYGESPADLPDRTANYLAVSYAVEVLNKFRNAKQGVTQCGEPKRW
jgi:hypothetical protein